MTVFLLFISALFATGCVVLWQRQMAHKREAYIRTFVLPAGLFEKLRKQHPQLTLKDCQLVAHGLRQFFLAHLKSGRQFVSMPSQVADDLWHEFILYTRNYKAFCDKAFGQFMHHTPAVILGHAQLSNAGLRRCWRYVCKEETINPRAPSRLPLLFVLDAKLDIPNGFRYVAHCDTVRRQGKDEGGNGAVHCGGDFSSSSFDGGTAGLDDSGGSGDGASHGGHGGDSGDGGSDGCGGGCGGGGD
jgi:hypothetical protein